MLALNELSFVPLEAASRRDADLMFELLEVVRAIRNQVSVHEAAKVAVVVPDNLGSLQLPSGTPVIQALQELNGVDAVAAEALTLFLASGPWFDQGGRPNGSNFERLRETATVEGVPAAGISAAIEVDGLSLSLGQSRWARTPLQAGVEWVDGTRGVVAVENAWEATLTRRQRQAISRHAPVLPDYENPGHHEPGTISYVAGKSHIPVRARDILRFAVPITTSSETWWARCEHGFFHRFQGSVRGDNVVVHWNGTTNEKATQSTPLGSVPEQVRRRLARLEPASPCGCRET